MAALEAELNQHSYQPPSEDGPQAWHPGGDDVKVACRAAADVCRTRGAEISVLGMQYCFGEPRVPSTISGAATVEELRTNLRAMTDHIDAELLTDVQAVLAPVRNHTWKNGNWVASRPAFSVCRWSPG